MSEKQKTDTKVAVPTDSERLAWCLKYGSARTLGVVTDFEYVPLTLELIDRGIVRDRESATAAPPSSG